MNEDYTKLRSFAQKRLENGQKRDYIHHWYGYLAGLDALYKKLYRTEEALEKQTARKPYFGKALGYKNISGYLCPICNNWLLYPDELPTVRDSFCSCCGQKIDWSEVAE